MITLNQIDDSIPMTQVTPLGLDKLFAEGYRLLGRAFVRHNYSFHLTKLCKTLPLRIDLEKFQVSKSMRKLLRQNADLIATIQPIQLNSRTDELFELHKNRFEGIKPKSIASFLAEDAAQIPVTGKQINVFFEKINIAQSFIHLGEQSVSATYCIFDTQFLKRSLGTYTMLLELEYAQKKGFRYYYHGYVYDIPSQFDYKLNFDALESYNWETGLWSPEPRVAVRQWRALEG